MKCHSSALWNRLRILTRMCTVCGDKKQGFGTVLSLSRWAWDWQGWGRSRGWMCRIWPSHLSSASPWSSLVNLGAKANPVWGCVPTILLAAYMCSHIIILAVACIACGILPAFRDIHTGLRAYSWFGPLFRPFAGVPQGRVRYRTEVRVQG